MIKIRRKFSKDVFKYATRSDCIIFWCSGGIDENKDATILFNNFLLNISKEHNIFFSAYRLPDVNEIIDASVIMSKAEMLLAPFHTFFRLSEAKVKSNCFDNACEATIYYFDKSVNWADFLATSSDINKAKLMKEELLFAYFSSLDQGADFRFKCNRKYENKVFELMDGMSSLGWQIKRSHYLLIP